MEAEYPSRLHHLRERFIKRLADDLQQIEKIAEGNLSDELLMGLTQLAHKLAGISGSLGFADLSKAALALDREWDPNQSDFAELRYNVQKLREASNKHLPPD